MSIDVYGFVVQGDARSQAGHCRVGYLAVAGTNIGVVLTPFRQVFEEDRFQSTGSGLDIVDAEGRGRTGPPSEGLRFAIG